MAAAKYEGAGFVKDAGQRLQTVGHGGAGERQRHEQNEKRR